jgi:hypothetical protein
MRFTGYSGNSTRTIVASVRNLSPLSFLWYTVHETVDTAIGGSDCATFYYKGTGPPSQCYIYWATGDKVNGPMYTQDQLLVEDGGSPVFGRNSQDAIASQAPETGRSDICAFGNCQNAQILGASEPDVTPQVPLPSDNSNLLPDATKNGTVYSGTTTLTVAGTLASGWNCPTSSTCTQITNLDLTKSPIVYATNASGCDSSYDPTNVTYPTSGGHYYGPCGDVYISGTYTTPLTIAAADDVVVTGNLTTTTDASGDPTGSATLGLVANQYVRAMHTCSGNPDVTIDGAILTLQHSFFVDNYNCGGASLGVLSVHGAIAQFFRGIVGQVDSSGYLKNYVYDDRLALILPPYLFDLQHTRWTVFRETLCSSTTSAASTNSCAYTGS